MRKTFALLSLLALAASSASAIITFTQIDDDVFTVSHRVKLIGSRAQAERVVLEKAASLCVAAGYSHYAILHEESEAAQEDDMANATLRVRLFLEDGDGRIDCEPGASAEYVEDARQKLAQRGYSPPDPLAAAGDAAGVGQGGTVSGSCTLEQIAAMARAGLSDEQIRAACP